MSTSKEFSASARKWFGRDDATLSERERRVLARIAKRQSVSVDVQQAYDDRLTFGQHVADQVAKFGGSWTFILCFLGWLAAWVLVNELLGSGAFDAYPFIFLNLLLSMLAAIQAPVIMMSQNRHADKDRLAAQHDYEVNLKAEIEIMALHEKLDQLRTEQLTELITRQQEQIALMTELLRHMKERPETGERS